MRVAFLLGCVAGSRLFCHAIASGNVARTLPRSRPRYVRLRPDTSQRTCLNHHPTPFQGDSHVHRRQHSRNHSYRCSYRVACSQGIDNPGRSQLEACLLIHAANRPSIQHEQLWSLYAGWQPAQHATRSCAFGCQGTSKISLPWGKSTT
jgi:hypothetical protein